MRHRLLLLLIYIVQFDVYANHAISGIDITIPTFVYAVGFDWFYFSFMT